METKTLEQLKDELDTANLKMSVCIEALGCPILFLEQVRDEPYDTGRKLCISVIDSTLQAIQMALEAEQMKADAAYDAIIERLGGKN